MKELSYPRYQCRRIDLCLAMFKDATGLINKATGLYEVTKIIQRG